MFGDADTARPTEAFWGRSASELMASTARAPNPGNAGSALGVSLVPIKVEIREDVFLRKKMRS